MSAGRNVTITLTQAEAAMLIRVCDFMQHGIMAPTSVDDMKAVSRSRERLDHQLRAVRHKDETA